MTNRASGRDGTGVVEMLVAVFLVSVVMAAMVGVLLQQQRFYLVTGDAAATTGVVHRLETVMISELMPINPSRDDVTYADPDSVAMRVFRGVYAVCDKQLAGSDVQLTVRTMSEGIRFQTDSFLVFSHGTRASVEDNHWKAGSISSVKSDACPDSTAGWSAIVHGLNGVLSEVPIGAPVRAFHHGSYWLRVRNGDWHLMTDSNNGGTSIVGGKLAPADSSASSVLVFRYLDGEGKTTATLADIERIEIQLHAVGEVPTTRGGEPLSRDRLLSVKLRNAKR